MAQPLVPSTPSWLAPAGPAADGIAVLTWIVFVAAAVIYLAVLALLGWAIARGARAAAPTERPRVAGWMLGGGAAATLVLITLLLVLTLQTLAAVLPPAGRAAVTIEITGHQWWWAARYPGATPAETADTANEIHVPVGERVEIQLLSRDVIHSFWVPQLQGKLDLIPGKRNV